MAKYRKKSIVVEAFQVTNELIRAWAFKTIETPKQVYELDVWWIATPTGMTIDEEKSTFTGKVRTLEGDMIFKPTDWLVTGIAGEQYPIQDEIFKATYEEITISEMMEGLREKE